MRSYIISYTLTLSLASSTSARNLSVVTACPKDIQYLNGSIIQSYTYLGSSKIRHRFNLCSAIIGLSSWQPVLSVRMTATSRVLCRYQLAGFVFTRNRYRKYDVSPNILFFLINDCYLKTFLSPTCDSVQGTFVNWLTLFPTIIFKMVVIKVYF